MKQDFSIDDIYENNPFVTILVNVCCEIGIKGVNSKLTTDENNLYSLYGLFSSIMDCVESIRMSCVLARRYNRPYLESNEINEEKYMTYYFDMIAHKMSTIKELEFKIVHKIYGLTPEKGKYSWSTINANKNKINNEHLFNYFTNENRWNLVSYMVNKRQQSSHEGKITMPQFADTTHLIWLRDIYKNPKYKEIKEGDIDYSTNYRVKLQIKQSRKDALECITNIHRSTLNMTYCFFCALFPDLFNLVTPEIKQTYQEQINRALTRIEERNAICNIVGRL